MLYNHNQILIIGGYMHIKKSLVHRQLIALKKRGHLSFKTINYLKQLNLGHDGEVSFANIFDSIMTDYCETIHDFRFILDGSERQIDTVAIFNNAILIFEIKNHQRNQVFHNGNFYSYKTKKEVKSPLHQINDIANKFSELLYSIDQRIPIHSYVVYINRNFQLYNLPLKEPIIMYSQLSNFLNDLKSQHTLVKPHVQMLKDQIIHLNSEIPRYCDVDYTFESLNKGIFCENDGSELLSNGLEKYICGKGGTFYQQKDVVFQLVEDFRALFPDEKITLNKLYEFSGKKISHYKLQKVLNAYYEKVGVRRGAYYVDKEPHNDD